MSAEPYTWEPPPPVKKRGRPQIHAKPRNRLQACVSCNRMVRSRRRGQCFRCENPADRYSRSAYRPTGQKRVFEGTFKHYVTAKVYAIQLRRCGYENIEIIGDRIDGWRVTV